MDTYEPTNKTNSLHRCLHYLHDVSLTKRKATSTKHEVGYVQEEAGEKQYKQVQLFSQNITALMCYGC